MTAEINVFLVFAEKQCHWWSRGNVDAVMRESHNSECLHFDAVASKLTCLYCIAPYMYRYKVLPSGVFRNSVTAGQNRVLVTGRPQGKTGATPPQAENQHVRIVDNHTRANFFASVIETSTAEAIRFPVCGPSVVRTFLVRTADGCTLTSISPGAMSFYLAKGFQWNLPQIFTMRVLIAEKVFKVRGRRSKVKVMTRPTATVAEACMYV